MTELPDLDGKAAYLKAQKQRNMYIGLGLAAFVILVFFVSMTRMAQNTRHHDAAPATDPAMSASAGQ